MGFFGSSLDSFGSSLMFLQYIFVICRELFDKVQWYAKKNLMEYI